VRLYPTYASHYTSTVYIIHNNILEAVRIIAKKTTKFQTKSITSRTFWFNYSGFSTLDFSHVSFDIFPFRSDIGSSPVDSLVLVNE